MVVALCAATMATRSTVAGAVANTVSGVVFNDVNNNGSKDASDLGVSGVTVTAYDSAGANVGTTVTAADGSYTLTAVGAASNDVRIEFSTPLGFESSQAGTNNGTSIQFTTLGSTGVSYGVHEPLNYCADNAVAYTTAAVCQWAGTTDWLGTHGTVQSANWTVNSGVPSIAAPMTATTPDIIATKSQTGNTWGLAHDRSTGLLYVSASIRRHTGFGPEGIGGVYAINPTTGQVVTSFDLTAAPYSLVLKGAADDYSDAARGITSGSRLSEDIIGYNNVGKAGIGDIDISLDQRYLWVVNLYQQKVVRIALGGTRSAPTLGAVTSFTVPSSTCSVAGSTVRPWALHMQADGSVIVGAVCDNGAAAVSAGNLPESGNILRLDPSGAGTWSTVLSFAFDGSRNYEYCPLVGSSTQTTCWHAWTNDFDAAYSQGFTGYWTTFAQPMIVDIEQTNDGSFVLGVNDRWAMQTGYENLKPAVGGAQWLGGSTAGDLLLACKTGATWTMETNSGVTTDSNGTASCGTYSRTLTKYRRSYFEQKYQPNTSNYHIKTTQGGLLYVPSSITNTAPLGAINFIASTRMDPNAFYSGGIGWNNMASGSYAYIHSQMQLTDVSNPPASILDGFGKTNMMGDLELLCDAAPIEIGNRVWVDTDKDGIQDPGETPIAGVTVHLYNSSGTLVGTAITDAKGEYYFSSTVSEAAGGDGNNIGGGVVKYETFTIKFDNPADYDVGGPLFGYALTSASQTAPNGAQSTAVDSNAAIGASTYPEIAVGPHGPGMNDFTFDAGFYVQPVGMGNYLWVDADGDGVQDGGEVPLAGVTVQLYLADGVTPATKIDGSPATATTDASGMYFIDGLAPGTYTALFTLPSGYDFTKMTMGSDVAVDSNPSATTGLTSVFTLYAAVTGNMTADSDPGTLALFVDLTIDAGVTVAPTPVGMGNYVWIDADMDGLQDAGELPLAGVVVTLYNADGTAATTLAGGAATATTDANGYYFIDNLAAGNYYATFTLPSGYTFTTKGDGTSALDSNPDATTGITPVFTIAALSSGDTVADTDPATLARFVNPTIDAGVVPVPAATTTSTAPTPSTAPTVSVSVGDYVWWDIDRDGIQDSSELPIPGVTLAITKADGTPVTDVNGRSVTTTVTDANGKYSFDNLPPGQYKVTVTPPAGATATRAAAGSNVAKDSSTGTALSRNMTTNGDRDPTLDFGFYLPSVAVGDRVWRDVNGDGMQGRIDKGLKGFTLSVRSVDGTPVTDVYGRPVKPLRTGPDGKFSFKNLPPGQYEVLISYPASFRPTTSDRPNRKLNSSTFKVKSRVLTAGQEDITLDFGVVSKPRKGVAVLPATR